MHIKHCMQRSTGNKPEDQVTSHEDCCSWLMFCVAVADANVRIEEDSRWQTNKANIWVYFDLSCSSFMAHLFLILSHSTAQESTLKCSNVPWCYKKRLFYSDTHWSHSVREELLSAVLHQRTLTIPETRNYLNIISASISGLVAETWNACVSKTSPRPEGCAMKNQRMCAAQNFIITVTQRQLKFVRRRGSVCLYSLTSQLHHIRTNGFPLIFW